MMTIPAYPHQDLNRESRIVDQICSLMHDDSDAAKARARDWIKNVLSKASSTFSWHFLERFASISLNAGDSIIDVDGDIFKLISVFCGETLIGKDLTYLVSLRQQALRDGTPNAGVPQFYAIEARKRIHLWPIPYKAMNLDLLYSRNIHVSIVPDEWESLILDGVIGLYGRHFDRDSLTQDAVEFERRWLQGLKVARSEHFGVEVHRSYYEKHRATSYVDTDGTVTVMIIDGSLVESFYPIWFESLSDTLKNIGLYGLIKVMDYVSEQEAQ